MTTQQQPSKDPTPSHQHNTNLSCASAVAETTKRRKTMQAERNTTSKSVSAAADNSATVTTAEDADVQICAAHRVLTAQKALLDQEAETLRTKLAMWKTSLTELQRQCTHPHDQRYKTFSVYADTEWHCPSCGRVYVQ